MITYGTNPGMGMPITGRVPDPAGLADAVQRRSLEKALAYMGLTPGQPLLGVRWTSSSSAVAPTAASPTCARPRRC